MNSITDEIIKKENEMAKLSYQLRFAKDEKIRLTREVKEIRQAVFRFSETQRNSNAVHYAGIIVGVVFSISSFLVDTSMRITVGIAGIGIIAVCVTGLLEMRKNNKRYRKIRDRSDADDFLLNMYDDEKEDR